MRLLPGKVIRPNPMKNSGSPPGPGTTGPNAMAVRMSNQPIRFFRMNQNQLAKTDGRRYWGWAYAMTPAVTW
jgi:hypothetical protein